MNGKQKLNKSSQYKKAAFLAAFSKCGSVTESAKRVKTNRENHYFWLKTDPEYVKAFEAVQLEAADALEDEATRRAYAGSDTLLIFLLKGLRPEKFRERSEVRMPGLEAKLADILRAREERAK